MLRTTDADDQKICETMGRVAPACVVSMLVAAKHVW